MSGLTRVRATLAFVLAAAAGSFAFPEAAPAVPAQDPTPAFSREEPFVKRPFVPVLGERWIGNAVAYGPYRDGQHPGGPEPTREEIREDLHLMAAHWNLIRLYGSLSPTRTLLEVIREDSLEIRVLLGIWIEPEERRDTTGAVVEALPQGRAANRRGLDTAVALAAEFPEIVLALSVGNETQVDWSAHRVPPELLIGYLREARARVHVPVTTADDRNFWNRPESCPVAAEVDFVVVHVHPLWGGARLADALEWTRAQFAEAQAMHTEHLVVLGETGWATKRHTEGEEAKLMKGATGEDEQKIFLDAVTAWASRERIPTFFFEAFDENWKGGPHPDAVEKHWGLYRADRTPKKAMAGGD